MKLLRNILVFTLFMIFSYIPLFSQAVLNNAFFDMCKSIVDTNDDPRIVKGIDGWYFLKAEISHLSKKEFWGESAKAVSKSTKAQWADPLPAIVDFNNQLNEKGIELILLPVPAKAVVYSEKLDPSLSINERLDYYHFEFYKLLEDNGIQVIDILPEMLKDRNTNKMYCKTDAHWSAYACELAASAIADEIKGKSWYTDVPKHEFKSTEKTITVSGDLVEDGSVSEEINIRFISDLNNNTIEASDSSPVILMGDSHTLVFHEGGDMLSERAGIADQLAFELKYAVDLIGVRGSGSTASRVNLFRKSKRNPDYLSGKKTIIWCFSVREFTESTGGWKIVPVSPK